MSKYDETFLCYANIVKNVDGVKRICEDNIMLVYDVFYDTFYKPYPNLYLMMSRDLEPKKFTPEGLIEIDKELKSGFYRYDLNDDNTDFYIDTSSVEKFPNLKSYRR